MQMQVQDEKGVLAAVAQAPSHDAQQVSKDETECPRLRKKSRDRRA